MDDDFSASMRAFAEVSGFSAGRRVERVGQEQIHDLLFDDRLSWQAIIYDLINSELLLSRDLQNLDDILYGKKEERKYVQERIELDEDVPELVPRTPLPRFKKVTLQELMQALSQAISTETRRIKRVLVLKQHELEAYLPFPKRYFNLQEKISSLYSKLKKIFVNSEERVAFSSLDAVTPEERLVTFVSLLHLDSQQKIWLEQDGHFEEIWILLKEIYEAKNKDLIENLKREMAALEAEHEVEAVSGFAGGLAGEIGEGLEE